MIQFLSLEQKQKSQGPKINPVSIIAGMAPRKKAYEHVSTKRLSDLYDFAPPPRPLPRRKGKERVERMPELNVLKALQLPAKGIT